MRILADENFPKIVVEVLRQNHYDVLWIRTDSPGSSDTAILAKAQREERVIVTFDKDFGELAFRFGLPASCGIILFRVPPVAPVRLTEIVLRVLASRNDWYGG
jgi:predicted nuclease of predicted toxin-antitoxin system